jgi:hypothetical protein
MLMGPYRVRAMPWVLSLSVMMAMPIVGHHVAFNHHRTGGLGRGHHHFADPVGARVVNDRPHRSLRTPDIHQGGVGHGLARHELAELAQSSIAGIEFAAIPFKRQDHPGGRIFPVSNRHIGLA